MVYTSDFYTTRSYSRPVRTSYSVSYPSVVRSSRVYSTSYPIYSYKPMITQRYRVISSPIRSVYSPIRSVYSPVRTIYSPIRSIYSPVRYYRSPSPVTITTRITASPVRVYRSPSPVVTTTRTTRVYRSSSPEVYVRSYSPAPISSYLSLRTRPSVLSREYSRIENKIRPSYAPSALTNYLNSEAFINFGTESRKIRDSAQRLLLDIHSPVSRRARSVTPYYSYRQEEPLSELALKSYVSRITNPIRHVAKDVHCMSYYPEPAHKYVGRSHLASVRILGDRPYSTRNPLYSNVRKDVELLSYYLKNRRAASEVSGKLSKSEPQSVEVVELNE